MEVTQDNLALLHNDGLNKDRGGGKLGFTTGAAGAALAGVFGGSYLVPNMIVNYGEYFLPSFGTYYTGLATATCT